MPDRLFLEGTTTLELSAKGAGSDVRSWVQDQVGRQGARLFINNISEPGAVDTIINLHRGSVGVGTTEPTGKVTVHVTSGAPAVLGRNFGAGDGVRGESSQGHGVSGASGSHVGTEGICETGIGVLGAANSGPGVVGRSTSGTAVVAEGRGLFLIEASP